MLKKIMQKHQINCKQELKEMMRDNNEMQNIDQISKGEESPIGAEFFNNFMKQQKEKRNMSGLQRYNEERQR